MENNQEQQAGNESNEEIKILKEEQASEKREEALEKELLQETEKDISRLEHLIEELEKIEELIVNAKKKPWHEKTISFEQVIVLAFEVYETGDQIGYSVTYTRGVESKPKGMMVKGETIRVKNKEVFNVSKTGQS